MRTTPAYTEYHPRWYRPRVSTYWWLGRWPYLKFILRELTSVAVALFVLLTLVQLWALDRGPESYAAWLALLRSPWVIAFNTITFLFVIFHTITWFNLAPKAMAVRIKGKRLPDILIAGPNYIAWLIASMVVGWFVLRG